MLDRIVRAHQRKSFVSESMLTPKVNSVLTKLPHASTSLIVLHGALLDSKDQAAVDKANGILEQAMRTFEGALAKVESDLKPLWAKINAGQRAAIERTRQNLMRAFR